MEKIAFTVPDTGEEVEFFVVEVTRLNGINYLLVTETDDEEEEADAYILKDLSEEDAREAIYEIVEDENELEALSRVFAELLEDIDLEG